MKEILHSQTKPGDGITAPLRVVLSLNDAGTKFVTHIENMQVGGKHEGHYHSSMEYAGKDYADRCKRLGVAE